MEIVDILMKRDGLTRLEALFQIAKAKMEMKRMIDEGQGMFDVEDYLEDEFGLEPGDILMELI